jgi:hypothetical protein
VRLHDHGGVGPVVLKDVLLVLGQLDGHNIA